jgi:hypothetical protein
MNIIEGKPENYSKIIWLILISFMLNCLIITLFNINKTESYFIALLGRSEKFIIELFFWGALGATISSSLFLAQDKEINEIEKLKETPDPKILRFPDSFDVWMYGQRIVTSGILAIISAIILTAGLGYFEVELNAVTTKQKMLFIITSFLVGMYQGKFVDFLNGLSKRLLKGRKE